MSHTNIKQSSKKLFDINAFENLNFTINHSASKTKSLMPPVDNNLKMMWGSEQVTVPILKQTAI